MCRGVPKSAADQVLDCTWSRSCDSHQRRFSRRVPRTPRLFGGGAVDEDRHLVVAAPQRELVVPGCDNEGVSPSLPEFLRGLFWDQEFANLSWPDDWSSVTARVLSEGESDAIRWIREQLGDARLRDWLRRGSGRALSARQLRYWEIVLDLPEAEVEAWLADPARRVWEERARQ